MKTKEIRDMKPDEIRQRIVEEEEQIQQLNFQHAVGTLQFPTTIRVKRRLVARLKTILHEMENA